MSTGNISGSGMGQVPGYQFVKGRLIISCDAVFVYPASWMSGQFHLFLWLHLQFICLFIPLGTLNFSDENVLWGSTLVKS